MTRNAVTKKANAAGFTLIELMIAVAIVGILAAIAYPSYQEQVRKGKRADATGSLLAVAQRMERCYTQYNAYNAADCGVASALQGPGVDSNDGEYLISTTALSANAYTLSATPAPGSSQASDGKCSVFTYTSSGQKGISAGTENETYCW